MAIQRNWINAPSSTNPFRYLHCTRVLVDFEDAIEIGGESDGVSTYYRAYFLDGSETSAMVDYLCLEPGWPLETYAQHPFSGKRSY